MSRRGFFRTGQLSFALTLAVFLLSVVSTTFGQMVQQPAVDSDRVSLISSSGVAGGPFAGLNINRFLGAERFYNAGFTGASARLGNIEAGHAWNGHSTLNHVTTQVTGTGAVGSNDDHATGVTHMMSGRLAANNYPTSYFGYGIARGAQTWSGAIATSFGGGGSFSTTNASTASVYSTMMITGVAGQTIDVFNSSWGFGGSPTGNNTTTRGIDGMIYQSRKVGVFASGNSGPGTNTVSSPGVGFNMITVGALQDDVDANPYNRIASFSSRAPSPFFHAGTGQTINNVRATVDIVAPGQSLTTASSSGANSYATFNAGTSFSAPMVAGGAGLVVDAGRSLYAGNVANAIDGRVVKSVLLNSADKIAGWNNGQSVVAGVITTTQSLDYTSGAGRMNLNTAYDQYVNRSNGGLAGTTDVAGTAGGDLGNVATVGWDFGQVALNATNRYFIDTQVQTGTNMAVTLSWFAENNPGSLADFSGNAYRRYSDLNVRVFEFDNLTNRNIIGTIAESRSLYNSVEHLFFNVAAGAFYGIEVSHNGYHWNFAGGTPGEQYGLAWSSIPEPGAAAIFGLIGLVALVGGRRRQTVCKSVA